MEYDIISDMLERVECDTNELDHVKPSRDYLGFYGLEKEPFRDSIDPTFFYRTKSHEEAYTRMMFTVEHDISLGMIHSKSGMGKTLLSQMILTNLNESKYFSRLILISPKMSRSGILSEIVSELGLLEQESSYHIKDMIIAIQNLAIDLYHQNKKLVLLIDEAHFLTADALHILRTLTNIEVPERKLVTCILFAENSLAKRLKKETYDSIRSRMYHCHELRPLSEKETIQYMKYRILMSGGDEGLFTPELYKQMAEKSQGVCREVNKMCSLALYDGFITETNPLDIDILG
ncbi:AAA family ATPase [PVC group bacterium]|nr:AAA family ATPase [PVC group bacterium]